jgi:fructose-1,6-bisphosphatase/inositol monophosphatase family enzyme
MRNAGAILDASSLVRLLCGVLVVSSFMRRPGCAILAFVNASSSALGVILGVVHGASPWLHLPGCVILVGAGVALLSPPPVSLLFSVV